MTRLLRFLRSWYRELSVVVVSAIAMARAVAIGLAAWGANNEFLDFAFRKAGEGEVVPVELAALFAQSGLITGMVVGALFATSGVGLGWVLCSVVARWAGRRRDATEDSASWNYEILERLARWGKAGDRGG